MAHQQIIAGFCELQEVYETRHWLRRAKTRSLLTNEQIEFLSKNIKELTPKLNSYIGKVDETIKNNRKCSD